MRRHSFSGAASDSSFLDVYSVLVVEEFLVSFAGSIRLCVFFSKFDRIHLGDAVWSCSWELLCIGLGELFSFVVTACSLRACVRLSALCSVQSCPAGSKNC